jgi:cold shock CspA family protein
MSRYKEHRSSKRRGSGEDYTPDYHAAEQQPEYFSPRPNPTQGSEPVEASVKWFNADKGFGFVTVAGGSDAFLPSRALEMAGHSSVPEGARLKVRISQGGPSGRRGRRGGHEYCSDDEQGRTASFYSFLPAARCGTDRGMSRFSQMVQRREGIRLRSGRPRGQGRLRSCHDARSERLE